MAHDHGHGHDDGHGHHPHPHHHDDVAGLPHVPHASYGKLLVGFWIITGFMVVEITCGFLFNSLALLSDGFHMLSDSLALGLSAFAVYLGARRPTEERTFGYKRLEILAAFANGLTLILLSVFVVFQAGARLLDPVAVDARPMLWVASLGLVINLFTAWWLHRGEGEKTLNEQGAFWHVLGDLGASLAAVAAAVLILWKGWLWADPALSLVIAGAIAWAGLRVVRKSGHILIEGSPEGVEVAAVRKAMLADVQVTSVHDLHMWTLNGRDLYLSAHVETAAGEKAEKDVMASLTRVLAKDFKVDHITLQVGQCVGEGCHNKCDDGAEPARPAKRARRG